jgi:hypothetical protein
MIKNKQSAGAGTIGLTVYPPYPKGFFANPSMGPWSYQNGGDWTWFGGRMIQQLIHYGFIEEAWQEMIPMVERVKKNNGFYEWYSVDNKPRGSGQFRGSAGVLGKAIKVHHFIDKSVLYRHLWSRHFYEDWWVEDTCNFGSDLITYGRKETCECYQGVYMGTSRL